MVQTYFLLFSEVHIPKASLSIPGFQKLSAADLLEFAWLVFLGASTSPPIHQF